MSLAIATTPDPAATDAAADSIAEERATVGALLLAAPALQDEILSIVDDGDFADPRCAWITTTIRDMRHAGKPVDELTVAGWAQTTGSITAAPSRRLLATELHALAVDCPTVQSGPHYAGRVVEGAARRRITQAGETLSRVAQGASLSELYAVVCAESAAALHALTRTQEET